MVKLKKAKQFLNFLIFFFSSNRIFKLTFNPSEMWIHGCAKFHHTYSSSHRSDFYHSLS